MKQPLLKCRLTIFFDRVSFASINHEYIAHDKSVKKSETNAQKKGRREYECTYRIYDYKIEHSEN